MKWFELMSIFYFATPTVLYRFTIMEDKILNKRSLGNTGIQLSELGYGCASLWGKPRFTSDVEAEKLFFTAFDHNIRFFDTGYSYNESERRLGKCIKKLSVTDRQELIISTKCGTRISKQGKYYHDWSVDWMQQSVEISMKRLHIDHIDMLQVHGPTIDEISDEMLVWLYGLKEKGTVRAIGINTFDTDVLEWVCANSAFDFVMLDYNILRQDRESLIKDLYNKRIGIIAGAPLAQSLYSNRVYKVRSLNDIWYLLRAIKNFRGHMVEGRKYAFLNMIDGMTGNQAALRYVLDNKRVTSAVFGSVNPEHLIENIESVNKVLPDDVRNKIRYLGHSGHKNKSLDRK